MRARGIAFEASGRDDLEEAQRLVAGVPERVLLSARLPHELSGAGLDHLVADQVEETRRRIVEATVELHLTCGPAATQIAEVARRAGVQRRTVYNHFPDDAALFEACSAHWRVLHPAPDPSGWTDLRQGLRELYAWYRETEPMTANVLRDAQVLPSLRRVLESGLDVYLDAVSKVLAQGRRSRRIEAVIRLVTDFHGWRALAPLGDEQAVELAAELVERAEARTSRSRGTRARPARS